VDLQALKIDRGAKAKPTRPGRRPKSPWFGRVVLLAILAGAIWLFRTPAMRWIERFTLPEVQVVEVRPPSRSAAGAVRGTAANGYVVAARRAALSADTPGRIVELNVTEGSSVRKGDIVARLFSDEYAAAVQRADAEVVVARAEVTAAQARQRAADADLLQRNDQRASAEALLDQAKAEQRLAEEDFQRAEALVAQGISSPSVLDNARAERDRAVARVQSTSSLAQAATNAIAQAEVQVEAAAADVATATARITAAEAAASQARATLDKTTVRAPFDGIVVLKDAEIGEVVSPNSQGGSNARGSICTMVDRDSLEVQVDLPESSLSDIVIGAPATVLLDAWPDTPYPGRVDRIWPTANRQKATVEIRVTLDRRDDRLRPDMGVRVVFQPADADPEANTENNPVEGMFVIPVSALVEADGSRGVYVLEQDTVRFVPVQAGDATGNRVPVTQGLNAGQRVVAAPPDNLRSGDRVRTAPNQP